MILVKGDGNKHRFVDTLLLCLRYEMILIKRGRKLGETVMRFISDDQCGYEMILVKRGRKRAIITSNVIFLLALDMK